MRDIEAKKIDAKLKPVVANLERIGVDLYLLKDDLKENRESARRMVEAANKMRTIHQENQATRDAFGQGVSRQLDYGWPFGWNLSSPLFSRSCLGGEVRFPLSSYCSDSMAFAPVLGFRASVD